jgi:hypothetical protein
MSYKFIEKVDLPKAIAEIEDNYADAATVKKKQDMISVLSSKAPSIKDMKNGEVIEYDDGANTWTYKKIGGRLFKTQWTEVS